MAIRGKKRPLSERERRIWRNGLLKGSAVTEEKVLRALEEVGLSVTQFGDRLKLRGVEAEPPAEFSDHHPMAKLRRRS